jgi:ubiquinone/menaquinone biosynthesis C-methylase UbiE
MGGDTASKKSASYFKYDNQDEEWRKVLSDPDRKKVGDAWFRTDTVDAWRHSRMRESLIALVKNDADATWLTVGDGRYGTDANFLLNAGAKKVHCTDRTDTLIKIGSQMGFIQSFSAENAESLSFDDSSFDYVYCKESLHHFPRPYMALYEMFRVARKAVIITEPRDQVIDRAPMAFIVSLIRAALRRGGHQHYFEPVGNYVYSISEREIDKFLLGMNYTCVACTGCNDAYAPGVEFTPINPKAFKDKKMKALITFKIGLMDFLCRVGCIRTGLITAALFKEKPSESTISALEQGGWAVRRLPENPHR